MHSTLKWYDGLEHIVRENVSLAGMTSYKTGGHAEFFAEPNNETELGMVLARAADNFLPVKILGSGSNLLVADRGVKGLIVRLPRAGFAKVVRDGHKLSAGAGHSLPALVNYTVNRGMAGMECLVGVPGTVGAALRMNAGGKYGEIGSRVRSVSGFTLDGTPFHWDHDHCSFKYRDSGLKDRVVTRCEMELEEMAPGFGTEMTRQIISEKSQSQPLNARSAGCVFKNPRKTGVASAGKLIDEAGLKGTHIGGAFVSTRHANFLVTGDGATSSDLADLIRIVRDRVWKREGVLLELEIAVWGFHSSELLPFGPECLAVA